MADLGAREAKLVQYLNEAYGKEKELETALEAHIAIADRTAYKKRLKDHLRETKAQSKGLERRIKALGGKDSLAELTSTFQTAASKGVALAKGPLHALRGTSEAEKQLKNAKTEYWNEHEEIANYTAIEALADALGDKETAKLAREYRRQEERMAKFLERTIVQLTKEVVRAEIPAKERRPAGGRRSASSRRSSSSASKGSGGRAKSTRRAKSTAKRTASRAKSGSSRSGSRSGARRSGSSRSR